MGCEGCSRLGFEATADAPADGMTRRGFVERATLAAVAAVLAGCDLSSPTGPGLPTGGPYLVPVSDYPALAHVGGVAKVGLEDGSVVGIGRTAETAFEAYGLACTHEGTEVRVQGDGWLCPSHQAAFDTAGDVVRGPAGRPLVSVPCSYDPASGTLTVNGSSG